MARTCAVHPSGVGTLPLARMPDRRDLSAVGWRWSRAAGAAAQGGDHAASHDTRANARHSRRLTRAARIRRKEPVRRDVEDYAVITTCNGRAARAPPRCDPVTGPRAGLCGPANTAPRFLGDFDGNHGQSPGSMLRKSSICH